MDAQTRGPIIQGRQRMPQRAGCSYHERQSKTINNGCTNGFCTCAESRYFSGMKFETRELPARKRIAMVAHDHKKDDIIEWAYFNRDMLAKHELFATGTTGKLLEEKLDRPVRKLMSGPLGGDQQIGAMISNGEIDMLIFFWDPMEAQPHDTDIKALLRLAAVWNIPMATDRSTADFLLTSPLMQHKYECKVPDYSTYLKRTIPH